MTGIKNIFPLKFLRPDFFAGVVNPRPKKLVATQFFGSSQILSALPEPYTFGRETYAREREMYDEKRHRRRIREEGKKVYLLW